MTQARLIEIDTPNDRFTDPRRRRKTIEHLIADKALIDTTQSLGKSLKHVFQSSDDLGEAIQQAPAVELANIMSNSLNAKYALAFGIDLQRQLAAMQLEDCQIIRRSLDRDFPFGRPHVAWAVFRPALVSKDRLYHRQVQGRSAAIDQGLEDLLHASADHKDQISAILHLVIRKVIPKSAALLFFKIERKT